MKRKHLLIWLPLFCTLLLSGVLLYLFATNKGVAQAHFAAQTQRAEMPVAGEVSVLVDQRYVAMDRPAASILRPSSSNSFRETFYTQKDTWINEGMPTTNYGSESYLRVGRHATTHDDYHILVGFDLSSLPSNAVVVSATLEMYSEINLAQAASPAQPAANDIRVDAILADWYEMSVTWNTGPSASNQGDPTSSYIIGWMSWDVTNIVQGWITGTFSNYGILLRQQGSQTGLFDFFASPSSNRPRLIVTYVTQGSPMMLPAQKDTWINEGEPSTNYGDGTYLRVGRHGTSYDDYQTLLWFDPSDLPADVVVVSATLEMYSEINRAQTASPAQPSAMDIWPDAIHTDWDEMTVTWNTPLSADNQGDPPSSYSIGWMSWDVTNVVQGWASGTLLNHGILLRLDSGETGNAYFFPRTTSSVPKLTIYYEPAPCEPLTDVSVSGPTRGLTDTIYTFDANILPYDATPPFTYTWHASDQSIVVTTTSATNHAVSHSWATTGTKTVRATVQSCGNTVVATHKITIEVPPPACATPLTGLSLSGPTAGITGTSHTFTATVSPSSATPPITYTWRATGQSGVEQSGAFTQTTTAFTWDDPGLKTITATAENCGAAFTRIYHFDAMGLSQLPDLAVTNAWYEVDHPRIGYLIKNVGGSAASPGHVTDLYQGASIIAQHTFTQSLQPGAIRFAYVDYEWLCPPAVTSAVMKACADGGDIVGEGDDDNNCWQSWWSCDLKPPEIISGPTVIDTTEHTVAVAWQTDEPCRSRFEYSRWRYMTPSSKSDPSYETDHQVTLTGLENGSTYYYQVFVTDEGGNEINSAEYLFETLSPGSDPPVIEGVGLSEHPSTFYELYTAYADLTDAEYIDRVEFYLDGALLGTDYEPTTYEGDVLPPRYTIYFSPHAKGMTREDFFQSHTLEARAFTLLQVSTSKSGSVTPPPRAMEAEVTIFYPSPGRVVYIDGDVAPAGTELDVIARASEYEWACTGSSFSEGNPPGIPGVGCDDVEQVVEQIEILLDNQSVGTHSPSPGDFDHTFTLDLAGKALNTYTMRVVARTSDQNSVEITRDFSIVRGQPSLEFERQVTRNNNVFDVSLIVENAGTGTAYVDFIWDVVAGFQVIERSTAQGLYAANQANGDYVIRSLGFGSENRQIDINLFDGGDDFVTLPPGESFTIEYVLVPVLYQDLIDWGIGSTGDPDDQPYVQYSDGTDTYGEDFWASGYGVNDPELGITYSSLHNALIAACAEADYMLVTSPFNLILYADDIDWRVPESTQRELNRLLSKMAELAYLKNGVLGFVPGSIDSATLDDLLEPGGMWADALHPNFREARTGYVLFVGENEILPTQSGGYSVDYSDLRYANTGGAGRPELVLGRIVGNDMGTLRKVIEASVNFHRTGYGFDRSDAVLVSGRGDGEGTFWNDVKAVSNIIDDEFSVTKIRWKNHPGNYLGVLADATPNQDVILYRGHGNAGVWKKGGAGIGAGDVATLNFGSARPFVFALACTTGDYEGNGDYSIAEAFLRYGASVYVGSVETSSRSRNSSAARGFFNRWDATRSIGDALNDLMRDKWGDSSWWWSTASSWERWIYDYQLFGDPKFGATATQSAADQSIRLNSDLTPQGQTTLQVSVPDFEVTAMDDGWDYVEIPGGDILADEGEYQVPYWSVTQNYPQGQWVQDVVLTARTGMVITTGLNIPTATFQLDCSTCSRISHSAVASETMDPNDDWYPHIEGGYHWIASENPDGSTDLKIMMYPLLYNPQSTDVRFYQDFTFDVQIVTSTVEIGDLETDAHVYPQGDPVSIDLLVNNSGAAQDVIVSAAIRSIKSNEVVAGLPLRNLHNLAGAASFTLEWDSADFEPGDYYVEVELLNSKGNVLDRAMEDFALGITSGVVTSFIATSSHFQVGDTISVSMAFSNTGTVPITGTAIIRIHNTDGLTATVEFTRAIANLASANAVAFDAAWDTTGVAEGDYRVLGYVKYDGTASEAKQVAVSTRTRIYLPLVLKNTQ